MKLIRRNIFRNVYIVVIVIGFVYVLHKKYISVHRTDRSFKEEWGEYDVSTAQLDKDNSLIHEYGNYGDAFNGWFPDSKLSADAPMKDWHNKTVQEIEADRKGIGEQGLAAPISHYDPKAKQDLYDVNGFNALLSDDIALDRALGDIRHPKCQTTLYSASLPTVSVVIPFFEEHWTTLLRTVVSVTRRSPPEILKEVILVDDGSFTKPFLGQPLVDWMSEHEPKARVVRLPERQGLIAARQMGAKEAKGDVIVVLDSHCEVMVNWLPPLLEPILHNPRTAVCPLIDGIAHDDFSYHPQDNGGRGAFDWRLFYKRLPLTKKDEENLPEPFENPVMNGGLFAINRKFFFELGGYDEGLRIWGGEQYNLSFKIWMCGGRILDAPCSRVGHIFRHGGGKRPSVHEDFLSKNYKRVAVGWMDEYAKVLYKKNKHLLDVDPGDLSKELEVRQRMQCKSFSWYLNEVAYDLSSVYPPFEPPDFANGTIQSVASPSFCLDNGGSEYGEIIMYGCHGGGTQFFSLCYKGTIRGESEQFCFVAPTGTGQTVHMTNCDYKKTIPSHNWRYDPDTKQLKERAYGRCLESNSATRKPTMQECQVGVKEQQWTFKYMDEKLIRKEFPPF